jgi:hypothetical protein
MMRAPMSLGRPAGLQLRLVRRHKAPEAQRVRGVPMPTAGTVVRGRFTAKPGRFAQRVMVKVKYRAAHNGKPAFKRSLRDNAKYITRDGELKGVDQDGKPASREDMNAATHGWGQDNRYYKFILSPENGHRLDLEQYTREVMGKAERDLLTEDELKRGVKLEWFMVEHWDTDHPHVHVMMRARVEDRNLRLSSGYASHGLRARAREVATQHLGYRAERGTDQEEKRRVVMERRKERGLDPNTGVPLKQQEREQSRGHSRDGGVGL